jgi:hypothetical protein
MAQGAFGASNIGASTTNYTDDTAAYFIGQGTFTGPPDWTQLQTNPMTTTSPTRIITTGGSSWTVSGTGGSGKILSITLETHLDNFDNKYVIIVLQTGGGTFLSGAGNNFNPPPPPLCFVSGTRVLTQNGYKAIDKLLMKDLVVLSDGRVTDYGMKKFVVESANEMSAPYQISAGAFGTNKPAVDICLSPHHKIQLRKGVWISPERAAKTNPKVKQYGIGEPVTYWHIWCDEYLKDNLVCEGLVVESLATNKNYTGPAKVYTWSERLGGFTRPAAGILKKIDII